MPLENLHTESNRSWALWKIEEDEQTLYDQIAAVETISATITNPQKRLEFLAARVLLKELLKNNGSVFHGLTKDEFGKPFLKNSDLQISLTHSYPYVAAVINRGGSVGIDLEQPKQKLLKIAARVLSDSELKDAGSDLVKHCIYWCAKETLVKIHGKKDLVFSENLRINPFSRAKYGELIGNIIVGSVQTPILLRYFVYDQFVVVLNR
jgi:4'-phosphopantetheinyl transferase